MFGLYRVPVSQFPLPVSLYSYDDKPFLLILNIIEESIKFKLNNLILTFILVTDACSIGSTLTTIDTRERTIVGGRVDKSQQHLSKIVSLYQ